MKYYGMMAYEKFEAWKAAHQLALLVYDVTNNWPTQERFQLTSQVRRAALSIPTNISEGAAKRGRTEFRRYLDIARGSLSELTYLLHFSRDRGLLDVETMEKLDAFPSLPSRSQYPWDQLMDGSVWKLMRGADFGGKPTTFIASARGQAKRRGGTLKTRTVEDGVVVQFFGRPT